MNPHTSVSRALLEVESRWLAPARARLLRKAGIAHRRRVLDLGCGPGVVTQELKRRCNGIVVALDQDVHWLGEVSTPFLVCADAAHFPFASHTFDFIFTQNVLLWVRGLSSVIGEMARVLQRDGAIVCIEPDYGGMMEWPEEGASREIWIASLCRAGADPFIGRKLPEALQHEELTVQVEFLKALEPPSPHRWDLLKGLPLTDAELERVNTLQRYSVSVVHLPYFCVIATRSHSV